MATVSKKQLEDVLRSVGGIQAAAARKLGISRQAINKRVRGDAKLSAICDEVVEVNVDLAESKLLTAIKDGNMTAVIFYLKTKGKARGYVERQEQTGPAGGPVEVDIGKAAAARIAAILATASKRGA